MSNKSDVFNLQYNHNDKLKPYFVFLNLAKPNLYIFPYRIMLTIHLLE